MATIVPLAKLLAVRPRPGAMLKIRQTLKLTFLFIPFSSVYSILFSPLLASAVDSCSLCSWDGQKAAWGVRSLRLAVEEQGVERPGPAFTALLR